MIPPSEIWTFDYQGRLIWFFENGTLFHRGVRGEISASFHDTEGQRQWQFLPDKEHPKLYQKTLTALQSNLSQATAENQKTVLEAIAWISEGKAKEIAEVHKVYPEPVPILPPDRYLSLLIQISEGCPWNQCTFCGFYRERPFQVKSAEQIVQHIYSVRDFFGKGLAFRRSIFLGDANALSAPSALLNSLFPLLHSVFPEQASRGIYSFSDVFLGKRKSEFAWKKWKEMGLRRVYLGVETGSAFLLEKIRKPQTPEEVIKIVHKIKQAGITVGIILLTGLGGKRYQSEHLSKTIELLNALPLTVGDIIYLSDLLPFPGAEYFSLAEKEDWGVLSSAELQHQKRLIRSSLSLPTLPIIATYDIRGFLY